MNAIARGETEPRLISAYLIFMPQAEIFSISLKKYFRKPHETQPSFVAQLARLVFSTKKKKKTPQRHPPESSPTSPGEANSPRQLCRSHPSTQPLPPIQSRNHPRWLSRRAIRGLRRITTRVDCGEFSRITIRIIHTARRDGGGGRWWRFLRRSLGIGGRSIMFVHLGGCLRDAC